MRRVAGKYLYFGGLESFKPHLPQENFLKNAKMDLTFRTMQTPTACKLTTHLKPFTRFSALLKFLIYSLSLFLLFPLQLYGLPPASLYMLLSRSLSLQCLWLLGQEANPDPKRSSLSSAFWGDSSPVERD